jgi:chromosome segregation ATPase
MTDLTLETLRTELAPLRAELADVRAQVGNLDGKVARMRAQLDGLPQIGRALTVLQQETRALRAAFNDFVCRSVTAGEIEALHADVNKVQAENAELQIRLATVERLLAELQRQRP